MAFRRRLEAFLHHFDLSTSKMAIKTTSISGTDRKFQLLEPDFLYTEYISRRLSARIREL